MNDTAPDLWHDTTIVENRLGLFPPNWHYRPDHIPEGNDLGRTIARQWDEKQMAFTMTKS